MDITDAHISPVRRFDVSETESISERSTEEVRDVPKHNREHGERHDEASSAEPTFSSESESHQSNGSASLPAVEFNGMQGFSGLREELSQFSSASISPSLALATPTPAFPSAQGPDSDYLLLGTPSTPQGPNAYTGGRDVEDTSEDSGDQTESRNTVSVPEDDIHASRSSDKTSIGSRNEEHDDIDRTIPANRHNNADEDDLLTPHTRRRVVLLSVITRQAGLEQDSQVLTFIFRA
ncbi:hypothetical protein MPER_06007 [Moniliophthora perniciosa FA553]|nr:hypothetical protein MPER_06007 [Moniliophthora perniciosa FA553]